MEYMVENYLMGGIIMKKKVSEMVSGFNGTIASAVNGGSFLQANELSLSDAVTPVFNE